jgi:hypothetical protein
MLEHLLDFTPPPATPQSVTPLDKATPDDIVAAQLNTADWLEKMGAPSTDDALKSAAASTAQQAFSALTTQTPEEQRKALMQLKTPPAVRHLTGMLTAYDWEFVEQAKELRGYAVSQILEETKHPDAKIRLKALDMLGRVTEVALFTDRVEVKKADLSDAELEAKIKDKINRFMQVTDVIDVVESQDVVDEAPQNNEPTPDEPAESNSPDPTRAYRHPGGASDAVFGRKSRAF